MRIDPALRALRGDPVSQRHAQEAMAEAAERWRARADWQALVEGLKAYGAGAHLGDCTGLHPLLAQAGRADEMVGAFSRHFTAALADHSLGHVPVRGALNGSVASLLLGRSGRAMLSLVMFDGAAMAARPRAQSVAFYDGERDEIVLAGGGRGRFVTCAGVGPQHAELSIAERTLARGDVISLQSGCETLLIDEVPGRLVVLRLTRTPEHAAPTCEYALADGALLHQAAGDVRDSCRELMVTLLARMGRKDAAPTLAEIAREGSEHLRWQALRECLALDSGTGFMTLCAIAADAGDPLAAPAGALRAQLVEAYPVLATLAAEEEPACPA